MTYHSLGFTTGQTPVAPGSWQDAALIASGQESNDFTRAVAAHWDDPFSGAAMKDYGATLGAAGGAAACAALGVGVAASSLCATLGAWIGTQVLSLFKAAHGAGYAELVVDTINNWIIPNMERCNRNIAAYAVYFKKRAVVIEEVAQALVQRDHYEVNLARQFADARLEQLGAKRKLFAPSAQRYADAQHVLSGANAGPNWSQECAAADQIGIGCRTYFDGFVYPAQLVAAPGDAMDWSQVAGDFNWGGGGGGSGSYVDRVGQAAGFNAALDIARKTLMTELTGGQYDPSMPHLSMELTAPTAPKKSGAGWWLLGAAALGGGYWWYKKKRGR